VSSSAIDARFTAVKRRVESAAARTGRDASGITLVAVTKGRNVADVKRLYDLGIRHFGENRVPEAESKIVSLPNDCIWHMIGNVQRRKAPDVVNLFQRVDSVDRVELAQALNRRASGAGKRLNVLVEVNVSGEDTKHGIAPDTLGNVLSSMASLSQIDVDGLMTMAPFTDDAETVRPVFSALRRLAVDHGLPVISMGMSGDFEVAIEEGATEIRVGSALFE